MSCKQLKTERLTTDCQTGRLVVDTQTGHEEQCQIVRVEQCKKGNEKLTGRVELVSGASGTL